MINHYLPPIRVCCFVAATSQDLMRICLRSYILAVVVTLFAAASFVRADEAGPPPDITAHPRDFIGELGEDAQFSVVARSTTFLSYQWFHNDTPISGATGPSLLIRNARLSRAGTYRVDVTNTGGTVSSSNATLGLRVTREFVPLNLGGADSRVLEAAPNTAPEPVIIDCNLASDRTLWLGLKPTADGTCVLDTMATPGDTFLQVFVGDFWPNLHAIACDDNSGSNGLSARVRFPMQAGLTYFVAVDLVDGSAAGAPVIVSWRFGVPPTFVKEPQHQVARFGETVRFISQADGIPEPFYQWRKNGTVLVDQTNSFLTLTNLRASDAGFYRVEARNMIGNAFSLDAQLIIEAPLRLRFLNWSSNGARVLVLGPPGEYELHGTSDFKAWTFLGASNITTSGWEFLDRQAPNYPYRFYRAAPR